MKEGEHMDPTFEAALQRHLWKCELEFRVREIPQGSCVEWLEPMCESTAQIAQGLKNLGFRIRRIVDEQACDGQWHRWVVTTNGVVVFVNTENVKGFVALAGEKKKGRSE